jgi:hypothetical protein
MPKKIVAGMERNPNIKPRGILAIIKIYPRVSPFTALISF